MMPLMYVFVDKFHVKKSMYRVCPNIDPDIDKHNISEESNLFERKSGL